VIGIFVQQEAKVGGRLMSGRDGEQHERQQDDARRDACPLTINPSGLDFKFTSTITIWTMSDARGGLMARSPAAGAGVRRWITQTAHPITTLDPSASLADLLPLEALVGDAQVVGLGTSTRSAHELSMINLRVLRFLVERLGFRSLALEEDWTKGMQLDEFVCCGVGDPVELLSDARPFWRTREMVDALHWMRAYNVEHPYVPIRLIGVDITRVRSLAYDAVTEYVSRVASQLLDELEGCYAQLRPSGDVDIEEHVAWTRGQKDKLDLVERARLAYDLVEGVDDRGSTDHTVALQHGRAVVGFYEYYAYNTLAYAERCLAGNTVWWYEHTGDKIVYWGGSAHTSVGNPRTVSSPPSPPMTHRNAGAYLRSYFGRGYLSVGLTFDRGSVPFPVPGVSPEFVEAVLADVGMEAYLLGLPASALVPPSVRSWLDAPATTRLIGPYYDPDDDAAYHMCGGSLAAWYDVVIHAQVATPTRPL
jgi:erythromycin esterase